MRIVSCNKYGSCIDNLPRYAFRYLHRVDVLVYATPSLRCDPIAFSLSVLSVIFFTLFNPHDCFKFMQTIIRISLCIHSSCSLAIRCLDCVSVRNAVYFTLFIVHANHNDRLVFILPIFNIQSQ